MINSNKCCQEFYNLSKEVRGTAKITNGIIYLDQAERKHLTDWIEANEEEIASCPRCSAMVQKWIKESYTVSNSALF